jgi:lysophospholipase L1-like esterase
MVRRIEVSREVAYHRNVLVSRDRCAQRRSAGCTQARLAPRPARRRAVTLTVSVAVLIGLVVSGCARSANASKSSPSVATGAPPLPSSRSHTLSLVAVGDSIPYNSPEDCPGCAGFVDRYAEAAKKAIGTPIAVTNLSQHNGLTLPQLLAELDQFRPQITTADIIIVGIAHNSNELNADRPCGAPVDANQLPDWSKVTTRCAIAAARTYRPQYDRLYLQISRWRNGKPTILRTIDRYNDFTGYPKIQLTAADNLKVKTMLDTWNAMLCASATTHGFICADIYHVFNGPDGRTPSGQLLGADYTHPSDKGNAVIANTLVGEGFAPLA